MSVRSLLALLLPNVTPSNRLARDREPFPEQSGYVLMSGEGSLWTKARFVAGCHSIGRPCLYS